MSLAYFARRPLSHVTSTNPHMKASTMSILALSVLCVSTLHAQSRPEIRQGATFDAVALWYPQPAAGFFLSSGLGYGMIHGSFEVGSRGSVSDRTTAIGFQVGAGYDLR
ncbi:MAG TPA: hypothetical protein VGP25_01275, partial [Gemmatimonadaceae bacterium]|nr:hypothetical protein [Gemmatimonadaceae bacterium]